LTYSHSEDGQLHLGSKSDTKKYRNFNYGSSNSIELCFVMGRDMDKKGDPYFELYPNGKAWRILKHQLLQLGVSNYKKITF